MLWSRYVRGLAAAAVKAFGIETVRHWRWTVYTEFNNWCVLSSTLSGPKMRVSVSVCLSVCQSVCLSVRPSVYLSTCLPVYLALSTCLQTHRMTRLRCAQCGQGLVASQQRELHETVRLHCVRIEGSAGRTQKPYRRRARLSAV